MNDWVVDIAKMNPEVRSRWDWALLGRHHAQSTFTRNLSAMTDAKWRAYSTAVQAGAAVEIARFAQEPEGVYWASFCWFLVEIAEQDMPRWTLTIRLVA